MCWWDPPYSPDVMPPSLYWGGRAQRRDYDPRLPDGIHIEDLVMGNLDRTPQDFDGETAVYSGGLTATVQNGVQ